MRYHLNSLRYCFLCLGLLLGSQPLAAQVFAVDLPALSASQIATLPFRIEKVVDARANRTMLGTVQQGLDNHRVPASFRHNLETDLLALLRPLPTTPEAQAVVVRVHSLSIAEDIRASAERASAELKADFLLQQGDQYVPLLSVSTAVETRGLDVTRKHGGNVAALFAKALAQLAARPELTALHPAAAALSWDDVLAGRGYQPYRFPIQQTKAPQRGIYRTLQEFQADAPGLTDRPFQVLKQARPEYKKKWGTQPQFDAQYLTQNAAGQRQLIRGMWGLSDGENLYIFQRGEYFQLTPTAEGYAFTGMEVASPNELATAAAVGGLAGMAIVSALANDPVDYELNVTTGLLYPLPTTTTAFADAATDSAAVYVYHRSNARSGAAVPVIVASKPVGTLGADQYVSLAWRDLRREMNVCVGTTCYSFLPVPGSTTYLAYQETNSPATLKPVAAKEGLFQLKHIRAREKKPAN